jgi:hypothetical protein
VSTSSNHGSHSLPDPVEKHQGDDPGDGSTPGRRVSGVGQEEHQSAGHGERCRFDEDRRSSQGVGYDEVGGPKGSPDHPANEQERAPEPTGQVACRNVTKG